MRLPLPLVPLLAALPLVAGEPSAPVPGLDTQAAEIVPMPDRNDTVLPLEIPGYELRTLEARKHLLLDVEGTQLRAELPVFFYFPKAASPEAAALVQRARDELIRLGAKPEWTGAELQAVIASLEAAAHLLEPAPPGASARPRA